MVLSIVSKECACSLRCCANLEEWLLVRNACLCSLYLTVKLLQSVQHKLSYSLGMLIYILRTGRICHGPGSYVLGGCVLCY